MDIEKRKEQNKMYYLKNKERIKEYYEKNKERISKRNKENRDKTREYEREYFKNNKKGIMSRRRKWYHANREEMLGRQKKYKKENNNKVKKWSKTDRTKNKVKIKQRQKEYYQKNKKKRLEYEKRKRRENVQYNIRVRLSTNFNSAKRKYISGDKIIISKNKNINYKAIIEHLKPFPENLKEYHIDHIIPQAYFDLTDEEQVKKAWNPINFQWMKGSDNISKGKTIDFKKYPEQEKVFILLGL